MWGWPINSCNHPFRGFQPPACRSDICNTMFDLLVERSPISTDPSSLSSSLTPINGVGAFRTELRSAIQTLRPVSLELGVRQKYGLFPRLACYDSNSKKYEMISKLNRIGQIDIANPRCCFRSPVSAGLEGQSTQSIHLTLGAETPPNFNIACYNSVNCLFTLWELDLVPGL